MLVKISKSLAFIISADAARQERPNSINFTIQAEGRTCCSQQSLIGRSNNTSPPQHPNSGRPTHTARTAAILVGGGGPVCQLKLGVLGIIVFMERAF